MSVFYPEGVLFETPENKQYLKTLEKLEEAKAANITLEARASICDSSHNLIVDLECMKGIIPKNDGAIGIASGQTRDIALISKVGKPVCFKVKSFGTDMRGNMVAILSRKAAQEEFLREYVSRLECGDIVEAKVTHLEHFGAFVDIGCGIPSLIPIDAISVSRISHPADRFSVGDTIRAVVKLVDENQRVYLSHKELLGTWEENAAQFCVGETVDGIIRSVEDYGIFVELTPNLAGLAEPKENARIGNHASVYIKAIIPDKMKIKLVIVDIFDSEPQRPEIEYYISESHINRWQYSTDNSDKTVCTDF